MSKPTNTLTRRSFLKGTAYASALSVGGLSGIASANPATLTQGVASNSNTASTSGGLLAITLSNNSGKAIALNPQQPVSLEKVSGWVVVKINKASTLDSSEIMPGQQMSLAAGQACSFPVDAEVAPMLAAANANIVITDEFSSLDNMVPVTPFVPVHVV